MTLQKPQSREGLHHEGLTALKFAAVGGLGFLTDITVLRLSLMAGLTAYEGRAISLACAMQVTFVINGLFVFRCLELRCWPRQWLGYMATNGFGNLCNYLIFAGLVASRWPVVSHHGWALILGSVAAYTINYLAVRLLVFGKPRRPGLSPGNAMCDPPLEKA